MILAQHNQKVIQSRYFSQSLLQIDTLVLCLMVIKSIKLAVASDVCRHIVTLDVAWDTSRIIFSKAAVSSICFWLCRAIFSLNFLGFEAMFCFGSDIVVVVVVVGGQGVR